MKKFGYGFSLLAGLALTVLLAVPARAAQSLIWNTQDQRVISEPGATNVHLAFSFTNTGTSEIVISRVVSSCGCTLLTLPPLPWHVATKAAGEIPAVVDLRGKFGILNKTITVESTEGTNLLHFNVVIQPSAEATERAKNQQMAFADRQAVFKGECVKCHVDKGVGKMGAELYEASCAICHDSPNLAVMVPDLKVVKHPASDKDYWMRWITVGREGSLMPKFAQKDGGPLSDEQIKSLVDFLGTQLPGKE